MKSASENSAQVPSIGPADLPDPPATAIKPVTEVIHGIEITDPYRYLEDATAPETQQFVEQQLAHTRGVLDRLPGRESLRSRLAELLTIGNIGTPQIGGRFYFYTRREGTQNQPVLYVREGVNGADHVLVDVNKNAADGTLALDWWQHSHDGRYVAYGTSLNGSELSTLNIVESSSGTVLHDHIPNTRAASVAWLPDDSGFYYTRYPSKGAVEEGEELYNRRVFFHRLGDDPALDPLVFGDKLEPTHWPHVTISDNGHNLSIEVAQGWTKSELWLMNLSAAESALASGVLPEAVPVAKGMDALYHGHVFQNTLFILTNEDAPRFRLIAVPIDRPNRSHWKEIVPEGEAVIKNFAIIAGRLVVEYEHNASSQLRVFDLHGNAIIDVALPAIGSLFGIGGEHDSHEAFFGFHSYTIPPTIFRLDMIDITSATRPERWAQVEAPIDSSPYDVKQLWFSSKDGTRVPMFVVAAKDVQLNGQNPTLLTGYGGFNVSHTPAFGRAIYAWLERGGVFAVANLRGGAEFGEEWHRAGMLEKKQNTFDDFIAAAEFLIEQKFTDAEHLAIQGGSNGGLLMGAMITQRPDLFRAVICQVPLLDMLRYQNFQIAKLWIPEYGSADDPEQFKYIYAYSPYHQVKEGTRYPAVLFMTADTDTRVDPMHAKKMAARLQAANGGERPILLRIEPRAGHGAGKPVNKLIDEQTDLYSFLFWQLGVRT